MQERTRRLVRGMSTTSSSMSASCIHPEESRFALSRRHSLFPARAPARAPAPQQMHPRHWSSSSEIHWNGLAPLNFRLKRKHSGRIVVNGVKPHERNVDVGSELRLVGGIPVRNLQISEIKQLMLTLPKPLVLTFVNYDQPDLDGPDVGEDSPLRGLFHESFVTATASDDDDGNDSFHLSSLHMSPKQVAPVRTAAAERVTVDNDRDHSKFKRFFSRVGDLLNRPVRRSALFVKADKCMVV